MLRLLASSCSLFFLIYSQTFLVTSVRGKGLEPTIAAKVADGVIGFMNAAFGLRAVLGFAVFFATGFAAFLAGAAFFATGFAAFLAGAAFFAAGFAAFLAGAAFAAGFFTAAFFAAGFFAAGFLAAGFLAVAIFKPPSQ